MFGLEVCETIRPIAHGRLDDGRLRELIAKRQDLELISVDAERKPALAESVLEQSRSSGGNTRDLWIHE
jgi:hypothetical protein